MARPIVLGGAQMGPIQLADTREDVIARMLALMDRAHAKGVEMLVFPELALTTFFPRWYHEDWDHVDRWFEAEMPGPTTAPLFERAKTYSMGFYLGYAERFEDNTGVRRFNTSILVDKGGQIVGKYRKVHLPGHVEYDPALSWQHLEKRYFEVGDLGWPVWRCMGGVMGMALCNDRRWPETYRVMGLQGVELVMLGYNTPVGNSRGPEAPHLRMMHNHMSMQMGAYQNGTWVVGVAKAGDEDGFALMGGSIIAAPSGEIVAQARTLGDELIVADADFDDCTFNKTTIFNFAAHRRPEHYGIITGQAGATPPPED